MNALALMKQQQRKIRISILSYDGTIRWETASSLMETLLAFTICEWQTEIRWHVGDCIVARARAQVISDFYKSDCTDLVFVDNDVGWQAGALIALCAYPVDMVAASVPMKTEPQSWPVRYLTEHKHLIADRSTGLLEVEGVGAALLRLSRAGVEAMVAAHPELEFACSVVPGGRAWDLFAPIRDEHGYWGEDYSFCRRWRAIGGKVWLDPTLTTLHVGSKVHVGNIGKWLRSREGFIPIDPVSQTFAYERPALG